MEKSTAPDQAAQRRSAHGRVGRPANDPLVERKKILAAASHVFLQHGYAGATLEMVGKRAGITKRTIYNHVGNKETLFRTVCREHLPLVDSLRLEPECNGGDLRANLIAVAGAMSENAFNDDALEYFRLMTRESQRFPRLIEEILDEAMKQLRRNVAGIFSGLATRGQLNVADYDDAIEAFYDVIVGNRLFRKVLGHPEPPRSEAELAKRVDMFITGYLGQPAGPHETARQV